MKTNNSFAAMMERALSPSAVEAGKREKGIEYCGASLPVTINPVTAAGIERALRCRGEEEAILNDIKVELIGWHKAHNLPLGQAELEEEARCRYVAEGHSPHWKHGVVKRETPQEYIARHRSNAAKAFMRGGARAGFGLARSGVMHHHRKQRSWALAAK